MSKLSWIKPLTQFKTSDRALIVTVAGIEPNVGVTHLSIMLASYLVKQHLKVAVVECNKSRDFSVIEQLYEGTNYDGTSTTQFKINGITYYKDCVMGDIVKLCQHNYDVVVLDVGSEITSWYEEIMRSDKPLFVGFFNDWKRENTMDFVVRYSDLMGKRSKLLLRTEDKSMLKEAKKASGIRTYPIPCQEDPFVRNKLSAEYLQRLMED